MGETYTRQSSSTIVDGATIEATHFNAEFDQLLAAFAASTGHTHDGTAGEGGPITKLLGNTLTFGAGTAGTDITITFDGETSDGVLKWMEDEDYFEFSDDILVASTEKLQFRDTDIYINSSADGQLDLVADTEVQIAATTVDINGNVDISGTLTVAGALDFGDASITNVGSLALDSITSDGSTITLDSSGDIILDADGADITLKDGGTTFGSLTNSSGELVITSGSTPTAAITLSGANATVEGNLTVDGNFDVTGTIDFSDSNITNAGSIQLDSISGDADSNTSITFSGSDVITMATGGTTALTIDASQNVTIAGDLTVTGDDITLGTNTSGHVLVADGTNFNPVAISGDVSIASNGAVTIASSAVENSMLAGSIADTKLNTISTAGKVALSALEIDGGTDIGAALADSDLFIVDDGAGGTNRKLAASRIATYVGASAGAFSIDNLDIDGGTDIGAGLADADLIVVDDGAGGTNRKAAMSRVATYVESGISGDITISSGTAAIGSGVIVNADINSSAAIADSKLATISTADKVSGAAIQIDGATDGTSITIADSDKLLVDDGGTTKYVNASQLNSYISAEATAIAADNITAGDAAINFTTTAGNITIDAQGNDTDIILKGTDDSSDTTFLTIDGSAAGAATFNSDVTVGALLKMPDVTSAKILVADGTSFEEVAVSGDVSIASNGAVTIASSAVENSMLAGSIADSKLNTISTAGKVALSALEIDGGSDIGADLTTSDLIIVDDGAGGTNRKAALSRLTTFMTGQGFSTEDPTALAIALG